VEASGRERLDNAGGVVDDGACAFSDSVADANADAGSVPVVGVDAESENKAVVGEGCAGFRFGLLNA
jgi:hypothetical protein